MLLLVQSAVIFVLFARTQDFGYQHYYLLLPAILICAAICLTWLAARRKRIALSAIFVLLVVNFVSAFAPGELWDRRLAGLLLTGIRHPPWNRNDIPEMQRMLQVLKRTLTDPADRVYVLASSRLLNSNVLGLAYLSLGKDYDVSDRVLPTHDVDLNNGFPTPLLSASHVLVAEPIQYHLRPEDQRVVGIPASLILSGSGIGTAFERLPVEFKLDGDVKVYLYRKVAPLAESDVSALANVFRQYYPSHPKMYQLRATGP
jgi:hypothetical protein